MPNPPNSNEQKSEDFDEYYSGFKSQQAYYNQLSKNITDNYKQLNVPVLTQLGRDAIVQEMISDFHRLAFENQFDIILQKLMSMDVQTRQKILKSHDGAGFTLIHSAIHHANLDALKVFVNVLKNDAEFLSKDPRNFISEFLNAPINKPSNINLHELTPLTYFLFNVTAFRNEEKMKEIFKFMLDNGGTVNGLSFSMNEDQKYKIFNHLAATRGALQAKEDSVFINPLIKERIDLFLDLYRREPAPSTATVNTNITNQHKSSRINHETASANTSPHHMQPNIENYTVIPTNYGESKKLAVEVPQFNLKQKFSLFMHGDLRKIKQLQKNIEFKINLYHGLEDLLKDRDTKQGDKIHIKTSMESIKGQTEKELGELQAIANKNTSIKTKLSSLSQKFTATVKTAVENTRRNLSK